jgi:short-subunit dehydrogenase
MKTILLTGASGGIGLAIISKLKAQGYKIIAVVKDKESQSKLEHLKDVSVHVADVSKYADIARLQKSIKEPIEWIVASHGFIDSETNIELQKPEAVEHTFKVNIISLFYITELFLKHITSGMIFISSAAGVYPNGTIAAYSASKAGVNALAVALAKNRKEKTFISLCPGPTATSMRAKVGATGGQPPEAVAEALSELISKPEVYKSGDVVIVRDGKTEIISRL